MATSTLPDRDTAYDPDADEKYAPGGHDSLGASSDQARKEVSDLEDMFAADSTPEPTYGGGEGGGSNGSNGDGGGSGSHDSNGDSGAAPANELNDAEQLGKGYSPDSNKQKKAGFLGKIRNSSNAKKAAILLGAGTGGAGLILVLFLLLMLASMLKIPDLAQNITNYEFARMSRQFADSAQTSSEEALALQGTDDATYTGLRGIYNTVQGKVSDTWSKLDKYRPGKVLSNLKTDPGGLSYNYSKPSVFGRQRLLGVSLNGKDFKTANTGFSRFVPGWRTISQANNEDLASFRDALNKSLMDQDVGPIVRGIVANNIRKELGISLTAWALNKFKGKSGEDAQVEETKERVQEVDDQANNTADNAKTQPVKNADEAAKQAAESSATDDNAVKDAISNNGIFKSVANAIATGMQKSGLSTALGIIDPAYSIAMPMCIIYDGSLGNSGPTIDQQTTQAQSAYYYIASAGDQEKAGVMNNDPNQAAELDAAAGGLNNTLGNTMTSNAYIRAGGGTVSTSGTLSPEASAGGQFTLLNALIGSNTLASIINTVANNVCPVLTSTDVAVAMGALNLAAGIATFGGETGAEDAAAGAADQVVTKEAKNILVNLVTRYIGQTAGRATQLLYDTGKGTITSALRVAAMTIVAKLIVISRSGQMFSGISMGNDLANEADAGGNIQGNELERTQLFGRPLLKSEVCQSNQADAQYVYAQESHRSAYDRYLSPNYADSLLSRTAVMFGNDFNTSYSSGLLNSIGSTLFKPLTSLGWLSSIFMGKTFADATANCNDNVTDYGIAQFGWSKDEEDLISSNVTYRPLENQEILDESGNENSIAQKYSLCFGYKYNSSGDGKFDPTDPNGDLMLNDGPGEDGSLGTIFSLGWIIRDDNANIIDAGDPNSPPYGLCSPSNLGYDSTDSLAGDPDSATPKLRDMIFRWRLAMRYDTTMDQLTSLQTTSDSSQ